MCDHVYGWTREDLSIGGRPLTDAEVAAVVRAIDNSTIPDALDEVVWACKDPANDIIED